MGDGRLGKERWGRKTSRIFGHRYNLRQTSSLKEFAWKWKTWNLIPSEPPVPTCPLEALYTQGSGSIVKMAALHTPSLQCPSAQRPCVPKESIIITYSLSLKFSASEGISFPLNTFSTFTFKGRPFTRPPSKRRGLGKLPSISVNPSPLPTPPVLVRVLQRKRTNMIEV